MRTRDWKPQSERREDLRRAHADWVAEFGEEPSLRELADKAGVVASTASVYLRRMRADGIAIGTRGTRSARCPHCGH